MPLGSLISVKSRSLVIPLFDASAMLALRRRKKTVRELPNVAYGDATSLDRSAFRLNIPVAKRPHIFTLLTFSAPYALVTPDKSWTYRIVTINLSGGLMK